MNISHQTHSVHRYPPRNLLGSVYPQVEVQTPISEFPGFTDFRKLEQDVANLKDYLHHLNMQSTPIVTARQSYSAVMRLGFMVVGSYFAVLVGFVLLCPVLWMVNSQIVTDLLLPYAQSAIGPLSAAMFSTTCVITLAEVFRSHRC